jgi:hypothetical protein
MDENESTPAREAARAEIHAVITDPAHPVHESWRHGNSAAVDRHLKPFYDKAAAGAPSVVVGDELSLQAGGEPPAQAVEPKPAVSPSAPLPAPPAPEGVEWSPEGGQAIAEGMKLLGISAADAKELTHYCVARYQAVEAGEAPPDPAVTEATLRRECAARGESYEDLVLAAQLVSMQVHPRIREVLHYVPALGNDPRVIRQLAAHGGTMATAYREIPSAKQVRDKLPVGTMAWKEQDRKVIALYEAAYGTRQIVID